MIYIVPLGFIDHLRKTGYKGEVIEVDTLQPLAHQIEWKINDLWQDIQPLAPEQMDEEERNEFLIQVHQALLSLRVTEKTYGKFHSKWVLNSLENFDSFRKCIPLLKNIVPGGKAIIVGAAALSEGDLANLQRCRSLDITTFACWAKSDLFGGGWSDFVCQLDPTSRPGLADKFHERQMTIAAPQADPKFVKACNPELMFGYFEPGNICNAYFAGRHLVPSHPYLVGTVASLMANAAVYMGFDEIALVGVTYGWPVGHRYDSAEGLETEIVTNEHHNDIETYSVFQASAGGFQSIQTLNPDVELYQTSRWAIPMPGVRYWPLSEFIKELD